jgi:hypothetical protein
MYTVAGNPLTFYPFDPGNDASPITLIFDLEADITQGTPDTAVVSGGGSIGNGSFTTEFTLDGLTVVGSGYPTGGEMTVDIGPYTAHIEYDGGSEAMMIIDGTTYFIDLETGETTVAPPTL